MNGGGEVKGSNENNGGRRKSDRSTLTILTLKCVKWQMWF